MSSWIDLKTLAADARRDYEAAIAKGNLAFALARMKRRLVNIDVWVETHH